MNQKTAGRTRAYVILCSVVGLIAGGVIGYFSPHPRSNVPTIVISTPLPDPTSLPTSTPAPIRVHVSGAVRQPDVYELPAGCIVKDAVEAAGGPTDDANLDGVNLAVELRDQQQVYVPRQGEVIPMAPASEGGGATSRPVDINAATAAELETLPGIGPKTAGTIVEYREANGPFETIEDIMGVPGIGEGIFEKIKDRITVGS
ncbi:MAG: helix-hairpin-helix domain-containing protein [Anaerolineae bacterium]|nr:helix-hairpin-helix domain-containing protein [Anaerolineae bacterium]